jgi:hypothetical protein
MKELLEAIQEMEQDIKLEKECTFDRYQLLLRRVVNLKEQLLGYLKNKEEIKKPHENEQDFKEHHSTSFHRCEWCGVEIVEEPICINNYRDFSVICARCLDWKRSGGTVIITTLNTTREPIVSGGKCIRVVDD